MTQKTIELIDSVTCFVSKNKDGISTDLIKSLFELGVMTEKQALRYVIKNEYWSLRKNSDISTRSAIIHLSVKWDISETSIENIIYKFPKIKA